MSDSISYISLAYLAVLIIPTLLINKHLEINLNKKIIISIVRMSLQLSLVGLYLQYLFDINSPWLNIAYLVLMMIVAAISALSSTGLNIKRLFLPIFVSILLPNLIMVIFFNAVVVGLSNPFDARYIITINGMLLGNILSADIVGLQSFYKGIRDNKKIVNYSLSLGATRYQATKPYLKTAITATLSPTIASMATMGLVSLPGMMTGQILGGSVPFEAILYQIGIMIAIYICRYINIYLAIMFTQNNMFDDKDQLIMEKQAR